MDEHRKCQHSEFSDKDSRAEMTRKAARIQCEESNVVLTNHIAPSTKLTNHSGPSTKSTNQLSPSAIG